MSNIIKVNPEEYGLQKKETEQLTKGLSIVLKEREPLEQEFNEVSKIEITHENLSTFRELRLRIVKNRTQGIVKWHKTAKDYFLRGGQFVDAIKRKEIAINEQMEEKLLQAEKYFELQEKKRLEELQNKRAELLSKYVEDAHERDLIKFNDEEFEAVLQMEKKKYEERLEAERKAEEERLERERKIKLHNERKNQLLDYWQFIDDELKDTDWSDMTDKDFAELLKTLKKEKAEYEKEQARLKAEAEKLRKEKELAEKKRKEAEAKAKAEAERKRKEYESKLEAERKERERLARIEAEKRAKLEAELKDKEEAEKRRLAEIEAKKQAELQKGDADKMHDLIIDLQDLKTKYTFKSKKYVDKYTDVKNLIDKIINHIK